MQTTFSELEYAGKKKKPTRRDRFLAEIDAVTPWAALIGALAPYYPKGEGRGRPPIGLERMLRMYVAQQCFGPACWPNQRASTLDGLFAGPQGRASPGQLAASLASLDPAERAEQREKAKRWRMTDANREFLHGPCTEAALTGARRGELLALRWCDDDPQIGF